MEILKVVHKHIHGWVRISKRRYECLCGARRVDTLLATHIAEVK